MSGSFTAQDVVTRVAPIGIRLWDVQAGAAAEDLEVAFQPAIGPSRFAIRTPSGVHTLADLPGLAVAERGLGDPPYWYRPPVEGSFRLTVRDPLSRYLPMDLDVHVPVRGLYRPLCGFPELDAPVVPVFSGPARPVPAGFAVVRAELELASGGPASWARLDVVLPPDGLRSRGVADGQGRVAVVFPYPEPPIPPLASLLAAEWQLGVEAYFGVGSPRAAVSGAEEPPEVCDVLRQRPAQVLAADQQQLTQATLLFGRELVLRTAGRSTLLLTGSP
jgi:hypothetical protein